MGHGHGDVRVGAELGQGGQQHLGAGALARRGAGVGHQGPQDVLAAGRLALGALQEAQEQVHVPASGPHRLGHLGDPPDDRGHLPALEDLRAPGHDEVQGLVPGAGPEQVLDGPADLTPVEVPTGRLGQQPDLGSGVLGPEAEPEQVAEQVVEAEPLPSVVEGYEEHRLPLELLEQQLGADLAGQSHGQLGAQLVHDRDPQQEGPPLGRLGIEHLLAQVVGDEPVVPTELGDEPVRSSRSRRVIPASWRPAAQPSVRCTRAPTWSAPSGRPVICSRSRAESVASKARSAWRSLGELTGEAVVAPGDRGIDPGGQHQVDVGGQPLRQLAQIGDEGGIGQQVQVVEDDDRRGGLVQLGPEGLEQGRSQPTAVQGDE